ncbi:MAG TPA: NAD-dependent epimerase/dehydratase family protein [Caldimonas sp.]|jgi:2'-hydroxyisoflavone reductase|nr:NAD-dependent epimerase/dehydratase family protein [Caldimonas sp.]HEX2540417.1 NAD-dependent epimerase/dehydratase family protein [Caldimonas sp.]
MDLLIIGGGIFLGAALVDAALARGHRLTVFNRGRARTAWPAGLEAIVGDRSADLDRLARRRFDAVIDTCGYIAPDVRASAQALRDSGCYCFVSSISAYASFAHAPIRESDALAAAAGIDPADRDLRHYGAQKAACEAAVREVFGTRALVVRPGLIVGAGDRSGRFSHWPWRALAGGDFLFPAAPPDEPLQFIDVRDLAAFVLGLVEREQRGAFNATGPAQGTIGWQALVIACLAGAAGRGAPAASAHAVDEAFLLAEGVVPWTELPLWLPSGDPEHRGQARVDLGRAVAAGLATRPLEDTLAAILDEGVPTADDPRRRGKLTAAREAELLARRGVGPMDRAAA